MIYLQQIWIIDMKCRIQGYFYFLWWLHYAFCAFVKFCKSWLAISNDFLFDSKSHEREITMFEDMWQLVDYVDSLYKFCLLKIVNMVFVYFVLLVTGRWRGTELNYLDVFDCYILIFILIKLDYQPWITLITYPPLKGLNQNVLF